MSNMLETCFFLWWINSVDLNQKGQILTYTVRLWQAHLVETAYLASEHSCFWQQANAKPTTIVIAVQYMTANRHRAFKPRPLEAVMWNDARKLERLEKQRRAKPKKGLDFQRQGQRKVQKSGGGSSNVVGIIYPPGWNRVNWSAKSWKGGVMAPTPSPPPFRHLC